MDPAAAARTPRAGISGSLEDVSVADVMQFIHLGQRSGTLLLERGDERAAIGFHEGRLVSARAPDQPKLGDLLVASGVVRRDELEDALADETLGPGRRTLGEILRASSQVDAEDLRRVVVEQIERTVSRVMRWHRGSFEFGIDDLQPVDDVSLYPGDVAPDADLDTQMVLLEAARIFDEQRTDRDAAAPDGPPAAAPRGDDDEVDLLALVEREIGLPAPAVPPADAPEIQLVGGARGLAESLAEAATGVASGVRRTTLAEAAAPDPALPAPVIVIDLRNGELGADDVETLRRTRPRASVVALVEPGPAIAAAYEAGAVAALPPDPDAVVACVENILRSRREMAAPIGPRRAPEAGMARLRRLFGELRSGQISATVALNLMHIVSESVERAVLFLVKHDTLVALGAFGSGRGGRPLAELTRGLRLDAGGDHALARGLETGEACSVAFEEADLPGDLADRIGRPRSGQVVVFPVLGAQRVIAVIYTDNGDRDREIADVDVLELATAQVGMAFENELLRRKAT